MTLGKTTMRWGFMRRGFLSGSLLLVACQADTVGDMERELERKNKPPVVTTTEKNFVVPENTTAVTTVTASDPEGSRLGFSLGTLHDEAFFSIGATSGVLRFKKAPNFESFTDKNKTHVYYVTVNVNDTIHVSDTKLYAPPLDLTVTVTDDMLEPADSPPEINLGTLTSLTLVENSSAVVTVITATDKDTEQSELAFALVANVADPQSGIDNHLFNLDSASGQLTFKIAPDADDAKDSGANNLYDLEVSVSDGEIATKQPFTVTVTGVDEPPVIANAMSIDENKKILLTPVAMDPENDSLKFFVVPGTDSPDAAAVTLGENTGILTFIDTLNYEIPADAGKDGSFTLTIKAISGKFDVTERLVITVVDVNDPPVLTTSGSITVPENRSQVSTVQATDEDDDLLTYSIRGGADKDQFMLTPDGTLSFTSPPNFESPKDANKDNNYEVIVAAYDSNADSNALTIQVTVSNLAEPPIFSTAVTGYSIPENTSAVATIAATDPDGGAIVYRLGGTDAALFSYTNGALRFITAPDYEKSAAAGGNNAYAVEVIAIDTTQASMRLALSIVVTNVTAGDFDPTFGRQGGFNGYISHNVSTSAIGAGSDDFGNSAAVAPDGKIVVAGHSYVAGTNSDDMAVWRLNADGSLDLTFGSQGVYTHHNATGGNGYDRGLSVALTTSAGQLDKIVVAGSSAGPVINGVSTGTDLAVWRLNADGSLDLTFGSQGVFTHHNAAGGNGHDAGLSVALTTDSAGRLDKIVVAGYSAGPVINGVYSGDDLAVWRLTANGVLDTDLSNGFGPLAAGNTQRPGYLSHHNAAGGNDHDYGQSVALTTDSAGQLDKIVVVGESIGPVFNGVYTGFDLAVWRLLYD